MAENKDLRFRILASIVGGDSVNRFNSELSNVSKSASQMNNQFDSVKAGLKGLAGAWVVKEAVQFTKNLINMADELDELSEKSGVAVEAISALQGMAEVEGISLQELTANLKKLSIAIVDTATGSKELKAVFATLGVDVKDGAGKLKDSGEILKEISDKFSSMENGAVKSAIAVKLFGKSGTDFIPFLNKGSKEIEKFAVAIDSDFAQRAGIFNDTLTEMGIASKNLALSGVKELLPTLQEIANAFKNTSSDSGAVTQAFRDVGEVFRLTAIAVNSTLASFYTIVDVIGTPLKMAAYTLKDIWNGVAVAIYDTARAALEAAQGNFTEAGNILSSLGKKAKEGWNSNLAEQNKFADDFIDRLQRRGKAMNDFNNNLLKNSVLFGNGQKGAIEDTKPKTDTNKRTAADLTELSKARTIERDRVKEFIDQLSLENKLRRESLGDINLTALELRKVTESRNIDTAAIKTSKTMTEEQKKTLMAATEEIKRQREEIIQQEYDLKRTYVYGAREYLREYLDNVTNNAKQIQQVMATTFSSLEDTMVDFVKTGKLNFRSFADAVISELIRIAVRQAVIAPIAGALSAGLSAGASAGASSGAQVGSSTYSSAASSGAYTFANGGIMTSKGSLPLNKYANGGVANSPQLALFGEGKTPEAYVPLPDGRSIPVTMKGSGSGDVNVSMSITVQNSGESSSVESDKQTGKNLGNLIKQAVLNTIVEQKRPGGLLAV